MIHFALNEKSGSLKKLAYAEIRFGFLFTVPHVFKLI